MRWVVLIACAILAGSCSPREAVLTAAAPDPAWDAVWARTGGWNGGDIGHSIDLGDGRTLWLFGDSIFGPVVDGRRVGEKSKMLRAGVAWHATPRGGRPGAGMEVTFTGPEPFAGAAAARWTQPAVGAQSAWPPGSWYWLMNDGVRLGPDRFVLFVTAIGPSGNPDGMWNFRRLGGAMLEVRNAAEPPERWAVATRVNPLVTADPKFGEPAAAEPGFNHAVAILPRDEQGGRVLYLYGVRYGPAQSRSLIVARATPETLTETSAWRFFDGRGWSAQQADAATLCDGVPDEFTVEPLRVRRAGAGEREELVLIQSESFLGRRIMARTALRPEGPWSAPKPIAEVAGLGDGVMVYAAKGHAGLSRPGELLVSAATNADLGKVFADASLYRPRFFRVPAGVLPEPVGLDQ